MRKAPKAILLLLISIALVVASTFTAAVSVAVTALIVPGTGTPNADKITGFEQNVQNYYLGATSCSASSGAACILQGVAYPASLWPLLNTTKDGAPGSFAKYGPSVAQGVGQLDSQLMQTLATTDGTVVIFGFSQGANVVSNELYNLANLSPATKSRLQVVVTGNTQRPNGGIWTRLGPLGAIPILDIPLGHPTPNNIGIQTMDIAFEYDPVGDAPTYPINLLADLNAFLGLFYIHATYIAPNGKTNPDELPDGYTQQALTEQLDPTLHPENFRQYGDTTYVNIPTQTLPIVRPILDIAAKSGTTAFVKPFVDLVSPTLRVLIDTGYNRSINPGVYTPFQLIPIINPFTFTADVVSAIGEGLQAFSRDLRGNAATAVAPSTPTTNAGGTVLPLTSTTRTSASPATATGPAPGAQLAPSLATPKPSPASPRNRTVTRPGNLFVPGATAPVRSPSATNTGALTASPKTANGASSGGAGATAGTTSDPSNAMPSAPGASQGDAA